MLRCFVFGVGVLSVASTALAQPTGTLIVLNKSDSTAQFIAQPSGETVATLPTGTGPHEAAVSADGRFVVAANYEDRTVSTLTVFDVAAGKVERTIDLGESRAPHGLAFVRGSGLLAVTCEGSAQLVLVDIGAGEVVARIATEARGSHMVAVTPDGTRAFVANIPDGTVSAIDLTERKLLKVITTGKGAEGIDCTPDGAEVWVTNRGEDTVSVIDAATLDVIVTVPCAGFPIRCKVTPDGERVLVSCATTGEVAVFDRAAREEIARVGVLDRGQGGGLGPIGVLVTPDGQHAVVANSNHKEVVTVDLETLEVIQRLETGNVPDGLGFVAGPKPGTPDDRPAGEKPVIR
jgi:YVTN family beta-propeller protein